ncbi:MAG: hypothetical protein A2736_00345 [Candidatus Yanofskybacteria bacterium RIFCSPHIGHO2_01_FULL_41_27]|uniref:Methyltransferase domain-containing protein n=1 Tax=Candidatus Yanofskybacteria bacterium RIFCSPHIGHO2_01_FULL_41_27 TaxID=1802662 RepID=A0A1F8EG76_9BACT|nr:MAG: hypothetical protein A2736_00345 [Candidatus Yanofskybacteria bacterium RIFCSPHIGHO2_01_FULL_41_27]OGN19899.1 MAG: hypothetical protein A3B00_00110 [Candidatus Yanofskybacteria bacterium RIFCSPLOWO2_01_FULL_41_33]
MLDSVNFSPLSQAPSLSGGFLDPGKTVLEFDVKEGMSIADFGCGTGYFTILLGQKVGKDGKVYALDVQEPPLDSVRAKAKAVGLENIEAIRANLEVLGSSRLPDNSQDMVLLANILFQSTKKREIISEAARVLKTGGSLIVIDWKKGTGGGPPDELRAEPTEMKALLSADIFSFQKDIDAGSFHYGMMFVKR